MSTIHLQDVTRIFARPSLSDGLVRGRGLSGDQIDHAFAERVAAQTAVQHDGPVVALDHVNLTIPDGQTFAIVGPSGCGKTTLLRVVAGLDSEYEGRILYDDEDVRDVPPGERCIGMVFQNYALYPHFTGRGNLGFSFMVRRAPDEEAEERIRITSEIMGIGFDELLPRKPGKLSGGQQQRVAIARALVRNPRLFLFDEPLSNLDAKLRVRMRGEIRALQRRLGITSVYVTHDQEEAFSIADRVAIMNQGKLVQLGTPRELYSEPADRFVADFVGVSNIVPVEVVDSNAGGATVRVFGQTIRSRRPPSNPGGQVSVVLRPEALRVESTFDGGVPARVLTLAFTGPLLRYTVAVDDGQGREDGTVLTIDLPNPDPDHFFAEGMPVSVLLPPEVPALLG